MKQAIIALTLFGGLLCGFQQQSETEKKPQDDQKQTVSKGSLSLSYNFWGKHTVDFGGGGDDDSGKQNKFGPPRDMKFGPDANKRSGAEKDEKKKDDKKDEKKDSGGGWGKAPDPDGYPFKLEGTVSASQEILAGLVSSDLTEGKSQDVDKDAVQKFYDLFKVARVTDSRSDPVHKVEGALKSEVKGSEGAKVTVNLKGDIKICYILSEGPAHNPLWVGGDLAGTLTYDKNAKQVTALDLKVEKGKAGGSWQWGSGPNENQKLGGVGFVEIKSK